jgi:hypothetical protein
MEMSYEKAVGSGWHLGGSLMAAPAFAQHKAPNQQPAT